MPQILFAVYANQKIRRSVWAKAHESARILKDSRGRAIQWDCRSEEEYFLIKMQKLTKEKFAKRFPLWRERGTVRFSEWWKVECCMLEHRKACWCMQYFCFIWRSHVQHPPPCNSCGIAPTMSRRLIFVCWDKGKHENVLSSFILKSERKPSDFWSAVW